MTQNKKFSKRKAFKKVGKVALSVLSTAVVIGAATPAAEAVNATEAAKGIVGSEGGKVALNEALKVARGKPALSVAASIVCLACIPVAGAAASPGLCIACGILIAKVIRT
jgi:hypothetical protein